MQIINFSFKMNDKFYKLIMKLNTLKIDFF